MKHARKNLIIVSALLFSIVIAGCTTIIGNNDVGRSSQALEIQNEDTSKHYLNISITYKRTSESDATSGNVTDNKSYQVRISEGKEKLINNVFIRSGDYCISVTLESGRHARECYAHGGSPDSGMITATITDENIIDISKSEE